MGVSYLDNFEMGACLRINRLCHVPGVRRFFSIVSKLGDYPAWLASGIAVALLQGTGAMAFALQAVATGAAGVLIYKLLKERLVRERPYISNGAIVLGEPPLDRYSFPSGHTLHATAFSILFCSYEPALFVVLIPFAVLVAISRIVLGLHYPSDVIAGAVLGSLLAGSSLMLAS